MLGIINSLFSPLWRGLGFGGLWVGRLNTALAGLVFLLGILLTAKLSSVLFPLLVHYIVKNTKTLWDDFLEEAHFFRRLSRLFPALAAYLLAPSFLSLDTEGADFVRRLVMAYAALMTAHTAAAFFDGVHLIYQGSAPEIAKRRPIKGYLQLVKVFLYLVGVIFAGTTLADVSPVGMLSGLGAMSAVLLLIFKDAILGFVSSMQLASNDMVRIGDWIEMPKYDADGTVIDVTLQSVKVRNWDNTITAIPIYALVSDSFKNWRGMSDSEGRRIKRSIFLDIRSVRFLDAGEIRRLSGIPALSAYMTRKMAEIGAYNKDNGIPEDDYVSGRHLTNLGTYRAYTELYLAALPQTAKNLTVMARYLQPGENGLPLELYLFSSDKAWVDYEHIQADIMDHLLAIMPQFGLRVFQRPSGSDLAASGPPAAGGTASGCFKQRLAERPVSDGSISAVSDGSISVLRSGSKPAATD
ncbi:MAG: mechanosensitive ion channel family protein [Spirochaetaceae bacterium]|jgi:miniconductance mechanosensitive channel|nr:mechanosensitive ion channel family protein [Spirochaetaceae bacterium]